MLDTLFRKREGIDPQPFEYWLEELPKATRECRDYDGAMRLCSTSRFAWSTYYNRWGSNPLLAPSEYTKKFLHGLNTSIAAVKKVKENGRSLSETQQKLVDQFINNIEFRSSLLSLLHDKNGGPDAVDALLEQEQKTPAVIPG